MAAADPTSIKAMIQGMTGGEVTVYQGTVISASPLKIQVVNDDMLIITEANTYVPEHLKDHTVTVDISGGSVSGSTSSAGSHSHSISGDTGAAGAHSHTYSGTTESGGDPEHTHAYSGSTGSESSHSHAYSGTSGSEGAHTHSIASWAVSGATMTVYSGLKVGDKVHLLSFAYGKQYFVLGRV